MIKTEIFRNEVFRFEIFEDELEWHWGWVNPRSVVDYTKSGNNEFSQGGSLEDNFVLSTISFKSVNNFHIIGHFSSPLYTIFFPDRHWITLESVMTVWWAETDDFGLKDVLMRKVVLSLTPSGLVFRPLLKL